MDTALETTVSVMWLRYVSSVSMSLLRPPWSQNGGFGGADRAMSELSILGILLGTAVVLAAALAVFMLAGV